MSDELFEVSESTANLSLDAFCISVSAGLRGIYLREPTTEDIERIAQAFRLAGFPGCICCLYCSAWKWKNFPKALQGIMTYEESRRSVRMEVICSLDLWIWVFQFGLRGSMNVLNILEVRNHFTNVLSGKLPLLTPSYIIAATNLIGTTT